MIGKHRSYLKKTFNPRSLTFKFELPKVRTEKARTEFCFRTCRVTNSLPPHVDFFNPIGLKKRLTAFYWNLFATRYTENNSCSWHFACDCHFAETPGAFGQYREKSPPPQSAGWKFTTTTT